MFGPRVAPGYAYDSDAIGPLMMCLRPHGLVFWRGRDVPCFTCGQAGRSASWEMYYNGGILAEE